MKPTLFDRLPQARENLALAVTILTNAGVCWWIEAGTFLGCVRERCHFIDYDHDIDLGLLSWPAPKFDLVEAFTSKGFAVDHIFGTPERGYEISFKRHDIKLDLFFFYKDGDTLWHAAWWHNKLLRFEFPLKMILPVDWRTMENVSIQAPNDAFGYLQHRYGESWRVPRKNWRWWCDPKCINWAKSEVTYDDVTKQ